MGVATEDRLRGASVYEKQVFNSLMAHERAEEKVIAAYQALAEGTTSLTARYLIEMILDDERRHHRVIGELANTVRAHATLEEKGPRLPFMDVRGDPTLLAETRRFLASERKERAELRRLARKVRFVGDEFDAFIVRLMRMDTARHIHILRFLVRLLRKQPRAATS
jgi:hypothetical protein